MARRGNPADPSRSIPGLIGMDRSILGLGFDRIHRSSEADVSMGREANDTTR